MFSIKGILTLLIASNLFAAIVLLYNNKDNRGLNSNLATKKTTENPWKDYKFEDPVLAYLILTKLDVFEPVHHSFLDDLTVTPTNSYTYKASYLATTNDDYYCERHRAYFVDNPEFIFLEKNFLLDYMNTSLVRSKVVPSIGVDLVPNVSASLPERIRKQRLFDIPVNADIFFINGGMHIFRQIGKNFACLTQIYNHIPGHSSLNRKDRVAESAYIYAKQYADKPHCFNFNKFFPKTWTLYVEDQCKEFFNHFNSEEYARLKKERRIVYIRKVGAGAHKAKGVEPINEEEEKSIREMYNNGTKCGEVTKNNIIQHFIHNPLLLYNHKFDFRIYMVIASTNPVILYYHDGFLRVSLHEYDVNSNDKSVLLTNTDLSIDIFKAAAQGELLNGMNETELRNFQMWNFAKLHNYLLETGEVKDKNWLDNYLRPEFKKAMIHLIRMSEYSFLNRSSIYELFGVDFMLDSDLNLWFIECNTSPVLKGTSDEKEKFVSKMLRDQFEIVFGLLRSRTKRIIKFVNEIIREIKEEGLPLEDFYIRNLVKRREEFRDITRNRFEPEFEPSPNNGFSKIIDESYEGMKRYSNLIEKDCL